VRRAPVESFFKKLSFKINPLHRLIIGYEKTALEASCLKCLFTNSNMVKQELLEHYSTHPSKVHVLHNGVEWKAMENDFSCWVEKKPKIAKELGLNPVDTHLLFIGHGFKRKGLGLLLDALRHVKDRQFHLSILGTDKHLKKYEKLCAEYDLQGKVTFYGECKDTRKFYQLCDIVVIPSLYDPFANVTVEALAMGLFTVSSAFNGGSEILQEGTGSIFPDLFSAKESAKCLDNAMQHHKKTWAKSIKIRDSVKHLDFSSQTATLVDISLKHC
jgi:UDP-glucose:(heptosyl)LPS alpha-1,3-glucosyltransferase